MVYINILLIAVIVVIVIDITDFINNIKKLISSILTKGKIKSSSYIMKPFDCSLCMTFWAGLIYLIYCNSISLLNIAILLLIAISTPIINDIIRLLQDLAIKLIQVIEKHIF